MTTIGFYLVQHGDLPRVEHADEVKAGDLDVRQEAALRTLIALKRNNIEFDEADLVHSFDSIDEEYHFVSVALKWAYSDARRDLHGRSRSGSRKYRTERIDSVLVNERDMHYEVGADRFADERCARQLDVLESDGQAQVQALRQMGPEFAQAVDLMLDLQRLKALGVPIPNAAHSALARLRKATGLPLNVTLL